MKTFGMTWEDVVWNISYKNLVGLACSLTESKPVAAKPGQETEVDDDEMFEKLFVG